MAIAGQIEYKVVVDTDGLKKGLESADKENKSFADRAGSVASGAIKAVGAAAATTATTAGAAIVGLTKQAVQGYGDFEQFAGGIEAMFGGIENGAEQIANVMGKSEDAWQKLTMSQNDYLQAFSSAYPLMKVDIEDQNEAIEKTHRLMTLNSDLANTFGYSMETAATAVNWALKGNFAYLDNLNIGIKGTQEGFLEAAAAAGYVVDNVHDLTSSDILDILEQTANNYGVMGRTADEAAGTIQGSTKMLKASWSNLVTGMATDGADIDTLMGNFTESVGTFAQQVTPALVRAIGGIAQVLPSLIETLSGELPTLIEALLPAVVDGATALLLGLVNALPTVLQVLLDAVPQIIEGVLLVVNAIMAVLPQIIVLIMKIIYAIAEALMTPENLTLILQAGVTLLEELIKAIPIIVNLISESLPEIIASIITFLLDPQNLMLIIEAAVSLFMGLVSAVPMILGALFTAFGNLFSALWEKLKTVFTNFAGNFGNAIKQVFINAINSVLGFIETALNGPINAINSFIGVINSVPGVSIGTISTITLPRLATGGIVPATAGGHIIQAGEGGEDEWVVPESKMSSLIEQLNGAGAGNITINVYGTFATSESEQRKVAEQIYDKLQELNGSRMGAYL